jgi:hypothetical protein
LYTTSTTSSGEYTTSGGYGSSPECQYQKYALQAVYVKAYVELTRLLAQYEYELQSHTCEDFVYESEGKQEKAFEEREVKLTTTIHSYEHKLEAYQMRVKEAYHAEAKLRIHIKTLTARCKEMDATVSSLGKVRDAIHVLGVCPGLGSLTFQIPRWTGAWKERSFDSTALTDEEIDKLANDLCAAEHENDQYDDHPGLLRIFRAAETSEILLRSLENMPATNTAATPLLTTCPNCEGDDDDQEDPDAPRHASGHYRICWDPDASLDAHGKRTSCTAGTKSVLCVEEMSYTPLSTTPAPSR